MPEGMQLSWELDNCSGFILFYILFFIICILAR